MLLVDLLTWWYSRGWLWAARQLFVVRSKKISEFFSIGDLAKTLFAPFRQDSIDTKQAPINVKLQAFGGNIISRIFGFFIRTSLICVGAVVLLAQAILAVIGVAVWPLLPLSPLISVVLLLTGWGV
jgi:uncharacterized membrane protein